MSTLGTSKASVREWPLSMDQTGSSTSQQLSQLLAISFSYPPQSEPRAIQVSRLLRHLNVATVLICEGTSEASSKPDATTKILRVPNQLSGLKRLSTRIAARFTLPVLFRTPDHLASWKNQV